MTGIIRGLTLRHPWAWAVRDLFKNVENRGWAAPKTMIGQYLAIHGGAVPKRSNWDTQDFDFIMELLNSGRLSQHLTENQTRIMHARVKSLINERNAVAFEKTIIPGIVSIVKLERCVKLDTLDRNDQMHSNPWAFGEWCWELSEVLRFETPIPCKGAMGLRALPPEVLEQVRVEWRKSKKLQDTGTES
jgi:hypothetical protein